jgi:hypothetical protein
VEICHEECVRSAWLKGMGWEGVGYGRWCSHNVPFKFQYTRPLISRSWQRTAQGGDIVREDFLEEAFDVVQVVPQVDGSTPKRVLAFLVQVERIKATYPICRSGVTLLKA